MLTKLKISIQFNISIIALIILSILALTHFANKVYADTAPIQYYANGIVTHDPKGIVLEKEILNIDVKEKAECEENQKLCNDVYDIEAIFYFNNPNENIELDTFFPLSSEYKNEEDKDNFEIIFNDQKITDFEIKEYKYQPKEIFINGYWRNPAFFTKLNFNKGENKLIVRYSEKFNRFGKTNREFHIIKYVLSSGSLWEGPIGDLTINVKFDTPIAFHRYTSTDDYVFVQTSVNTLLYKAYNLEPQTELNIQFMISDVWEVLKPYFEGTDYLLTYEERIAIHKKASWFFSEPYTGSILFYTPTLYKSTSDMILNNLQILVEDGYADKYMQSEYSSKVYFSLQSLTNNSMSTSNFCAANGEQYFEFNHFDSAKKSALYRINTYITESDIKAEYLEKINNITIDCEKYKQNKVTTPPAAVNEIKEDTPVEVTTIQGREYEQQDELTMSILVLTAVLIAFGIYKFIKLKR